MKKIILLSVFFTFNLANAQQAIDASPLAKSLTGQCEQAQMALATAQEAYVHLVSADTSLKSVSNAQNALVDTMFLTSKLVESLCK